MCTIRVRNRSEWRMFRLPLLVVTFLVLLPFSLFLHFDTVTNREKVTSTLWTSRRATPLMANTAICQTNEVSPCLIESALCDGALHLRPDICLMVWDWIRENARTALCTRRMTCWCFPLLSHPLHSIIPCRSMLWSLATAARRRCPMDSIFSTVSSQRRWFGSHLLSLWCKWSF